MKQLVIVARDRVGLLADISELLASHNINIESVSVEVVKKDAIIRILTKEEKKAKKILENRGFKIMASEFLIVKLENRPGELSKLARILADDGINIENVHLLCEGEGKGFYALKVDKQKRAARILREYL